MPPVTYHRDSGIAGRLEDLTRRLERLETGSLTPNPTLVGQHFALSGAWPASVNFSVNWSTSLIIIMWSASAFTGSNSLATMALNVDSIQRDTATAFMNTANGHMTTPTGAGLITSLSVGTHTAQISLVAGSSDSNDRAKLVVLEAP